MISEGFIRSLVSVVKYLPVEHQDEFLEEAMDLVKKLKGLTEYDKQTPVFLLSKPQN